MNGSEWPESFERYNKCADMFRDTSDLGKMVWLQPASSSSANLYYCENLVERIVACLNACRGVPTSHLVDGALRDLMTPDNERGFE